MKNILFYIPSFANGGAERVASVLLNYWSCNSSINPTVINTLPQTTDFFQVDESINRIFLDYNYNKKGILFFLERLKRLIILRQTLKNRNETIIISFMTSPSLLLLIASIGLDKKVICCEHTNYFLYGNKIKRSIRNVLYYFLSTRVSVLTERDLLSYPKYLQKKIIILPNPIGVENISPVVYKKPIKCIKKPIELLFVGRLVKVKGIERLCHILDGLKNKEGWHLTVCGEGDMKEYLYRFIKKNNLSNKVSLEGAVKNIQDYYLASDMLIMTSLHEGLPMVIAEAMSFSLPVIAFDCPTGPREFINDGINGILIADNDIEEYIDSLLKIIDTPNIIDRLASNTIKSIEQYKIKNINMLWHQTISLVEDLN